MILIHFRNVTCNLTLNACDPWPEESMSIKLPIHDICSLHLCVPSINVSLYQYMYVIMTYGAWARMKLQGPSKCQHVFNRNHRSLHDGKWPKVNTNVYVIRSAFLKLVYICYVPLKIFLKHWICCLKHQRVICEYMYIRSWTK